MHIKEKVEIKQAEDYIDAYGNTVKVKGPKKEKVRVCVCVGGGGGGMAAGWNGAPRPV